ncbi:MAG: DUF4395 family protein [Chloroflexi bacterium]|nr:DUF4395 family protein [Chloroflexota bacterium]
MSISPALRRRLEIRGVSVSDDAEFIRLVPWMRTTFVLCGTLVAIATAFAFTPLLWAMVAIAALGAALPVHPFDLIYNHGVRRFAHTRRLPHNRAPTRFACAVAAVWLIGTAVAFSLGVTWLGYTLGALLTIVGGIVSVTHFCIVSAIYQIFTGNGSIVPAALRGVASGND